MSPEDLGAAFAKMTESLRSFRIPPEPIVAMMEIRLRIAEGIPDGRRRHRAVKHARDNRKRARKMLI